MWTIVNTCGHSPDEIHALPLSCVIFISFGSCYFFHTVPSLQQNIHIKTLADDMVRCSAQLWCALVLFDIIICSVQCCMELNNANMYGWFKPCDQTKEKKNEKEICSKFVGRLIVVCPPLHWANERWFVTALFSAANMLNVSLWTNFSP